MLGEILITLRLIGVKSSKKGNKNSLFLVEIVEKIMILK
ncbi:hypothetical protein CUP0623 [Campylobacter upsaliensis RM3195]|nr:hypothetical protein CUP0623 [Campylobacter upsaliensis RM3195]